MTDNAHLKLILVNLPEKPGVYQYFNSNGEIIYVGKAKNLKRRVNSYFTKDHQSFKTSQLVDKIADIKYIVVESEQDAFLLENNLIKKYQPHYNILLKDGKSYPSIYITKEEYPRVFKTRKIIKGEGDYYGPYSYSNTLDYLLELIHELYPLRTCKLKLSAESIAKGKHSVCLKYHIHKCCGVCENKVSADEYRKYINEVREIITGNADEISELLWDEMQALSNELRFEEAAKVKVKYELLERFKSKTIITNLSGEDMDVFGYKKEDNHIYISILRVHKGSIIQAQVVEYKQVIEENDAEVLGRGIRELQEELQSKTRKVVVPFMPEFVSEGVKYVVPQRGDLKHLLDLAQKNAAQAAEDNRKQADTLNPMQRQVRLLTMLQSILHLAHLPLHIESFDNSNIQGVDAVAACVVFRNGKAAKDEYRHYKIKTVEGADDYASMREIVFRRYSRLIEEGKSLPDLIIADGGLGQMNAIRDVVEDELKLQIPIAGLEKDNHHKTARLLYSQPVLVADLKPTDEVFHLLIHIQDEVHRFAIKFHKQVRSKRQVKSELDEIAGIGEKTKKTLLSAFKSVKRISEADLETLSKICGTHRASIIYEHFHGKISG